MLVSNTIHLAPGIDVLDVPASPADEIPERLDQGRLLGDQVQGAVDRLRLGTGPENPPRSLQFPHVDPVVLPQNPRSTSATGLDRHRESPPMSRTDTS